MRESCSYCSFGVFKCTRVQYAQNVRACNQTSHPTGFKPEWTKSTVIFFYALKIWIRNKFISFISIKKNQFSTLPDELHTNTQRLLSDVKRVENERMIWDFLLLYSFTSRIRIWVKKKSEHRQKLLGIWQTTIRKSRSRSAKEWAKEQQKRTEYNAF